MNTRYLNIIRRWYWVLLAVPLMAAGISFILSKLSTPIYEASLTLWVSQASSAGGQQYADILASERLAKTYGALITKRPVLQETLDDLHLKMTTEELGGRIAVKMVRDTQLLEVTARDANPTLAANIVNTLAIVFVKQNTDMQKQSFNEAKVKLSSRISQLDSQIKDAETRLGELKAVSQLNQDQRSEIEQLNSSIAQYQSAYAASLKSLEEIGVSEASSINSVTVAEDASVPTYAISPRTSINMILGFLLGLLLAVGLVALLEYMDDSFKSPEDVQATLGLTTLGVVERVGEKQSRFKLRRGLGKTKSSASRPTPTQGLVALSSGKSHIGEAYRLLRTNLDFAALDKPLRKLLVTSAVPQEGKSTTAANLAIVMSQNGKRTLLVDVDLRRPTIHKLFKVPNHVGLTSLLLGIMSLEEAVQEVGIDNLRVLTSGPLPPSPADTLSSRVMANFLDTLAEQYDLVITDSPPVLVAPDAVIVASQMDGSLFVVASGSTSKRLSKTALQTLQHSVSPVLGVVLNMQEASKQGSYYYDYQATGPLNHLSTDVTDSKVKQLRTVLEGVVQNKHDS